MLDFSTPQGKVALAVIAAAVLVAGYLLWSKTAPPTPKLAPGQSLENPFGTAPAGTPSPMGPSPSAPFARGR